MKKRVKKTMASKKLIKSFVALVSSMILLIGVSYAWFYKISPFFPADFGLINNPFGYNIKFTIDGEERDDEYISSENLIPGKFLCLSFEISGVAEGMTFKVVLGQAKGLLYDHATNKLVEDTNKWLLQIFSIGTSEDPEEAVSINAIIEKQDREITRATVPQGQQTITILLYIHMSESAPEGMDINLFQNAQLVINDLLITQ